MTVILAITALIAAVTAREIARLVAAHLKAKDALKALKVIQETAEERRREADYKLAAARSEEDAERYRKGTADINRKTEEIKARIADTIAGMTPEQLEAYNKTLEPTVKYVPVQQYVPMWSLYNPMQSIQQQWRGW